MNTKHACHPPCVHAQSNIKRFSMDTYLRRNEMSIFNDGVREKKKKKFKIYFSFIYLKNKSKLQQLPLFN